MVNGMIRDATEAFRDLDAAVPGVDFTYALGNVATVHGFHTQQGGYHLLLDRRCHPYKVTSGLVGAPLYLRRWFLRELPAIVHAWRIARQDRDYYRDVTVDDMRDSAQRGIEMLAACAIDLEPEESGA